jgi:cell division inhibitor SulA
MASIRTIQNRGMAISGRYEVEVGWIQSKLICGARRKECLRACFVGWGVSFVTTPICGSIVGRTQFEGGQDVSTLGSSGA